MVTNHYYAGTERIACKLVGSVDSSIDNSLELSGSEKAGLPDRQAEDLELIKTEFGFDTLIIDDVDPDEDDCEDERPISDDLVGMKHDSASREWTTKVACSKQQ